MSSAVLVGTPRIGSSVVGGSQGGPYYGGPGGVLAQDSPDFHYDPVTGRLTVGASAVIPTADQVTASIAAHASQSVDLWQLRAPDNAAVWSAYRKNAAFMPASLADASVDNHSVFYSLTTSQLSYKDTGGITRPLQAPFLDVTLLKNFTDPTKQAAFSAAGITTGTTRTYVLPNANGTLPLLEFAQTWSDLQSHVCPVGDFYHTTRCALQMHQNAYNGIIWGTPPVALAAQQVTDPGVYFDPGTTCLEINFLAWHSVLGVNEKGKLRADGGTDPILHWVGGVTIYETSGNDVRYRIQNDTDKWWEFVLTSNTLTPLMLRRVVSGIQTCEIEFPEADGTFVVNAYSHRTASGNLEARDRFVTADATAAGGNITLTATFGNAVPAGTELVVKNIGTSNLVQVNINGGGYIDGDTTVVKLAPGGKWVRLIAHGTNNAWYITGTNQEIEGAVGFGIGLGRVNMPDGLTVAVVAGNSALGFDNIRMGRSPSPGHPQLIWEHAGYPLWSIDTYQGLLRFGCPGTSVCAGLLSDGSLLLGDNATPHASTLLDLRSTTKGTALTRMTTTQKSAISSPVEGLVVYDLTLKKLCVYTGSAWETITSV